MTLTLRRRYVRIFLAFALLIVGLITSVPRQFDSLSRQGSPFEKVNTNTSPPEKRLTDNASSGPSSRTSGAGGIEKDLQSRVTNMYGKLPLSFEENRGQADEGVKLLSRGSAYSLCFEVGAYDRSQPLVIDPCFPTPAI